MRSGALDLDLQSPIVELGLELRTGSRLLEADADAIGLPILDLDCPSGGRDFDEDEGPALEVDGHRHSVRDLEGASSAGGELLLDGG